MDIGSAFLANLRDQIDREATDNGIARIDHVDVQMSELMVDYDALLPCPVDCAGVAGNEVSGHDSNVLPEIKLSVGLSPTC